MSQDFCDALGNGQLSDLVQEAYGPAEFEGQTSKLVPVEWDNLGTSIDPVIEENCSFGARSPTQETVVATSFVIFVAGTNTSPENTTPASICIAVESDWQTGKISTRPIQVDVAKGFYGSGFSSMPKISVDTDGNLQSINFNDGSDPIFKTVAVNDIGNKRELNR